MARQNYSFEKRQRELAKKKKKEEKRQRKQGEDEDTEEAPKPISEDVLNNLNWPSKD